MWERVVLWIKTGIDKGVNWLSTKEISSNAYRCLYLIWCFYKPKSAQNGKILKWSLNSMQTT